MPMALIPALCLPAAAASHASVAVVAASAAAAYGDPRPTNGDSIPGLYLADWLCGAELATVDQGWLCGAEPSPGATCSPSCRLPPRGALLTRLAVAPDGRASAAPPVWNKPLAASLPVSAPVPVLARTLVLIRISVVPGTGDAGSPPRVPTFTLSTMREAEARARRNASSVESESKFAVKPTEPVACCGVRGGAGDGGAHRVLCHCGDGVSAVAAA